MHLALVDVVSSMVETLSRVMREASRAVGGDGGGHDVAAGATIPTGTQTEFVAEADRIVGEQLS